MNSETQERKVKTWRGWFRGAFTFDVRSLAVFRILVGIALLGDLVFRSRTFSDMYTESGLVTRELSRDLYRMLVSEDVAASVWSLYWISEATSFQIFLFVVAGVFATLLMLGKWTRVATIASWALLVSLQARNPIVLTSGDFLLKMCLFWCMFLPLGAVWSLDARRARKLGKPPKKLQVASFATAAFMLQLIYIYFFPGVAKLNSEWFSGDAMYYVLRLDIYVTELGRQLLDHRVLLQWVSWVTLFVEVIMVWAMLSSWQNGFFRWINLLTYWAFHLGIAFSMSIGLFPWICIICWIPLIPASFWAFCLRAPESIAAAIPTKRLDQGVLLNTVCAFLLAFVTMWNVFNIPGKTNQAIAQSVGWPYVIPFGYTLRIDQHFQMFGHPPKTNPWFVYEAKLRNGKDVDLFRGGEVNHDRPPSVRNSIPSHHWRKLHRNLVEPPYKDVRPLLAEYLVKKWNREHGDEEQVEQMRLLCYLENTGPGYNEANFKSSVWGSYVNPDRKPESIFDNLDKLTDDPLSQF